MSTQPLASLDPVLHEVRAERDVQLKHFDALDQKAGILLGFEGALVALSPQQTHVTVDIGRVLAVIAAGAALWTFWPRAYPSRTCAYYGTDTSVRILASPSNGSWIRKSR